MWWHTLVFRRNGRVHLNRRGRQFSRLLAAEVCASAEVMLDTPCSEVVWRVLATHSIPQFPLYFPSRAPPCAITFQIDSTKFFTILFVLCVSIKFLYTRWSKTVYLLTRSSYIQNVSVATTTTIFMEDNTTDKKKESNNFVSQRSFLIVIYYVFSISFRFSPLPSAGMCWSFSKQRNGAWKCFRILHFW